MRPTVLARLRLAHFLLSAIAVWALVAPYGCTRVHGPAPSRVQVESRLPGYRASEHFIERMAERDVSIDTVVDVVRHGERFYDPKDDSEIRWKDGVYVALAPGGVIKTVVRGPIERRWRPSPGP